MKWNDLLNQYQDAIDVDWAPAPSDLVDAVGQMHRDAPVPRPSDADTAHSVSPTDVRAAGTHTQPQSSFVTRNLDGIDVTVSIQRPTGEHLSVIKGRSWLNPRSEEVILVVLARHQSVMATHEVAHGEVFEFEEVLLPGWRLEFHLADGSVAIFRPES